MLLPQKLPCAWKGEGAVEVRGNVDSSHLGRCVGWLIGMMVPLVQFATANGLILLALLFGVISMVLGGGKRAVVDHFTLYTGMELPVEHLRGE